MEKPETSLSKSQMTEEDSLLTFPQLTYVLRQLREDSLRLGRSSTSYYDEMHIVLQEFIIMSSDVVDYYAVMTPDRPPGQHDIHSNKIELATQYGITMLQARVRPVRQVLSHCDLDKAYETFFAHARTFFEAVHYGCPKVTWNFCMFRAILEAVDETLDVDGHIRADLAAANESFDRVWNRYGSEHALPWAYRAYGAAPLDFQIPEFELKSIQSAKGPRINPQKFARRVPNTAHLDDCMICLDNFPHPADPPMVPSCGHVFHLACLNELVNTVVEDRDRTLCPLCRADICEARRYVDYREYEMKVDEDRGHWRLRLGHIAATAPELVDE